MIKDRHKGKSIFLQKTTKFSYLTNIPLIPHAEEDGEILLPTIQKGFRVGLKNSVYWY
jgi:hypothetical protein